MYWPLIMWLSEASRDGNTLYYRPSWSHYDNGYRGNAFKTYPEALLRAVKMIAADHVHPGNNLVDLDVLPSFIAKVYIGNNPPDVKPGTSKIRSIVKRIPLGELPGPR